MIDNIQVQKKIFDLYGDKEYSLDDVKEIISKYQDKAQIWEDGLKNYTTEQVLSAINEYWRFKNSEKKPRVAHIQAILETNKIENLQVAPSNKEQSKLARLAELTKQRIEQEMKEKWGA